MSFWREVFPVNHCTGTDNLKEKPRDRTHK